MALLRCSESSCHRLGEIVRQRRFKGFPFVCLRMMEAEFPGVQHLTWMTFRQFRPVNLVAQNGVAKMMKMNTNLMGAAAVQSALD